MAHTAQIPGQPVDHDGADLTEPTQNLLRGLSLLPEANAASQADGFAAAFTGPPTSVAVIEAGATALSKWWAGGLSGGVVAVWALVKAFWGDQQADTQRVILWAAAIITGATVLAIAYILASDVRGRAAAMVAMIDARAKVADGIVRTSPGSTEPPASRGKRTIQALFPTRRVANYERPADDEPNWLAIAFREADNGPEFLVIKGSRSAWVSSEKLGFAP